MHTVKKHLLNNNKAKSTNNLVNNPVNSNQVNSNQVNLANNQVNLANNQVNLANKQVNLANKQVNNQEIKTQIRKAEITPVINRLMTYRLTSLGANCYFKKFIDSLTSRETELFDYIGSSMKSINDLILNDYEDLCNIKYFERLETLKHAFFITNTKYYLRFPHDLKTVNDLQNNFNDFSAKYTRRITRWKNMLDTNNKILFLRYYENTSSRLIFYNDKDEYTHLEEFLDIIKSKYPNNIFKIIYIHPDLDNNYKNNIITLNYKGAIDYNSADVVINRIINNNKDFLMSNL